MDKEGKAPDNLTLMKYTPEVNCKYGRSALYFYKVWKKDCMKPNFKDSELVSYKLRKFIQDLRKDDSTCNIEVEKKTGKILKTCKGTGVDEVEDVSTLF
jgi:hypothetical protein